MVVTKGLSEIQRRDVMGLMNNMGLTLSVVNYIRIFAGEESSGPTRTSILSEKGSFTLEKPEIIGEEKFELYSKLFLRMDSGITFLSAAFNVSYSYRLTFYRSGDGGKRLGKLLREHFELAEDYPVILKPW